MNGIVAWGPLPSLDSSGCDLRMYILAGTCCAWELEVWQQLCTQPSGKGQVQEARWCTLN